MRILKYQPAACSPRPFSEPGSQQTVNVRHGSSIRLPSSMSGHLSFKDFWLLNAQLSALWCVCTCVCLSVCMYVGIPLAEAAWKQPCRPVRSPSLSSAPHPRFCSFPLSGPSTSPCPSSLNTFSFSMFSLIQTVLDLAGCGDTCMPETNAGGLGVWGSLSYQARPCLKTETHTAPGRTGEGAEGGGKSCWGWKQ